MCQRCGEKRGQITPLNGQWLCLKCAFSLLAQKRGNREMKVTYKSKNWNPSKITERYVRVKDGLFNVVESSPGGVMREYLSPGAEIPPSVTRAATDSGSTIPWQEDLPFWYIDDDTHPVHVSGDWVIVRTGQRFDVFDYGVHVLETSSMKHAMERIKAGN